MKRPNLSPLLFALLGAGVFACGDDDGGNGSADASVGADADTADAAGELCAEFADPAGTISSYPGSFSGDAAGAGADLQVVEGVCLDERDFYPQAGDDQVVLLSDLTPGQEYAVRLRGAADFSFYIATSCADAGPSEGECLLFVDQAGGREFGEFVAPDGGQVHVVIDQFSDEPAADASYTLEVYEPECDGDEACTAADAGVCFERTCVGCASPVDCTDTSAPVCDVEANTCVVGFDQCVGDDATESADDGPAGAVALAPTETTPETVNANICSAPAGEADYYSVVLDEAGARSFELDWTDTNEAPVDLDLVLIDSEGTVVAVAFFDKPEILTADLEAGTYYLSVTQFSPESATATTPYTLTARIPECQTSFDCELLAEPVCSSAGECVAGPMECVGDDAAKETAGDDGPAGAFDVTPVVGTTVTATSQICNTPATEADYYQVTVADGDGITFAVDWTDAVADLDIVAFDADGREYGVTFWMQPEVVTLSNLAAGTYYFQVTYYGAAVTDVVDYDVTVGRVAGGCQAVADCAAEYETQIYRGSCDAGTGACVFIEGDGAVADGEACDSGDDCAGGSCSYILFESDADLSVCSVPCDDTAECTAALGEGYACTVPFQQNFCHPLCDGNTQCGANPGSDAIDNGLPWDYLTCTADGACDL